MRSAGSRVVVLELDVTVGYASGVLCSENYLLDTAQGLLYKTFFFAGTLAPAEQAPPSRSSTSVR